MYQRVCAKALYKRRTPSDIKVCETINLLLDSLVDGEDQPGGLRCAVLGDKLFEVLIDKTGIFLRQGGRTHA